MAHNFQIRTNSRQSAFHSLTIPSNCIFQLELFQHKFRPISYFHSFPRRPLSLKSSQKPIENIHRTCKNCKTQFNPSLNHPRACRFHTAHFGGETKRKFESVYSGGTMNTPNSGQVVEYWHCCGSEDPFDPGCTAAPHSSYDD